MKPGESICPLPVCWLEPNLGVLIVSNFQGLAAARGDRRFELEMTYDGPSLRSSMALRLLLLMFRKLESILFISLSNYSSSF